MKYNASLYVDFIDQHVYENSPGEIIEDFEDGKCNFNLFGCWSWKFHSLYSVYSDAGLGDKPIWLTEFGWKSNEVGEAAQGANIVDLLTRLSARPRFEAAFIYELQDGDNFPDKWGMFHSDGSSKPVVQYLQNGYWNPIPTEAPPSQDPNPGHKKVPL